MVTRKTVVSAGEQKVGHNLSFYVRSRAGLIPHRLILIVLNRLSACYLLFAIAGCCWLLRAVLTHPIIHRFAVASPNVSGQIFTLAGMDMGDLGTLAGLREPKLRPATTSRQLMFWICDACGVTSLFLKILRMPVRDIMQ
jgi:hypothetical protein